MKAYLMATGSILDDVEYRGHDLKKLRRRCEQRGLTLNHPRADLNLDMIAPVHKQNLLRYASPGGIEMPGGIEFDDFVSSVLADIRPAMRIVEEQAFA
jgi:hypothetical protein